jgi:hypothetical protein
MKPTLFRNILIGFLAFLGVGAMFGGGALVISPSGELLGMPLSMIKDSPFPNFLIPAIFLFVVLGLAPCLLTFVLVRKPESKMAQRFNLFKDMHWSWSFSVYIGLILILWLQLEMMFIHSVHWSHTFYMFLAVAILVVAILPQVRNLYKLT